MIYQIENNCHGCVLVDLSLYGVYDMNISRSL